MWEACRTITNVIKEALCSHQSGFRISIKCWYDVWVHKSSCMHYYFRTSHLNWPLYWIGFHFMQQEKEMAISCNGSNKWMVKEKKCHSCSALEQPPHFGGKQAERESILRLEKVAFSLVEGGRHPGHSCCVERSKTHSVSYWMRGRQNPSGWTTFFFSFQLGAFLS